MIKLATSIFRSKLLLLFSIVSIILTSATGRFVFGVFQSYHTKLKQGQNDEKQVIVSATGSAGIKTSHKDYIKKFGVNAMKKSYTTITN